MDNRWQSSSRELMEFRRALTNPITAGQFRRYVSLKGDFLENDVLFWIEVQRYKVKINPCIRIKDPHLIHWMTVLTKSNCIETREAWMLISSMCLAFTIIIVFSWSFKMVKSNHKQVFFDSWSVKRLHYDLSFVRLTHLLYINVNAIFQNFCHAHNDIVSIENKVLSIINCFINSQIPPALQIDISSEMADKLQDKRKELGPYVFREAQVIRYMRALGVCLQKIYQLMIDRV